jgi:hypothetical protein
MAKNTNCVSSVITNQESNLDHLMVRNDEQTEWEGMDIYLEWLRWKHRLKSIQCVYLKQFIAAW